LLYVYLIQHRSWHQVERDKAELAALNFLYYIGEPKKEFDQYLKTLSAAYNDLFFNPLSVVRLSDQVLSRYLNPHIQYFGIDHSSICRVLSDNGKEVEYTSLFTRGRINHSKYKGHRIY
jgi:hypothetical protein